MKMEDGRPGTEDRIEDGRQKPRYREGRPEGSNEDRRPETEDRKPGVGNGRGKTAFNTGTANQYGYITSPETSSRY